MGRPNAQNLPQYLRRRGDGTYLLDYPVSMEDGSKKRKIEVLGPIPKAKALEIWKHKIGELAEQRYVKPRILFHEAADAFLEYSKSRKRSWIHDVQLCDVLKAHFKEQFLDSITPDVVERFLNALKAKGKRVSRKKGREPEWKPYKPGTLNRYIACMKTIVNRAIANGKLDKNPLRGVKLFKENNVRDRTLTPEEYEALLQASSDHLKPIVILGYVTGMRKGEIVGLRWEQLFLAEKVIRLMPEDTKTNEGREIPLDDGLVEMLRAVPRVVGCPYVFTHERKPMREVKTAFHAACRRAGLKDFRFHDLRHCAITNLRKAFVPDNVIMSISGHKTTHMLRRYDKVDREDRNLALARVRKFYESRDVENKNIA